MTAITTQYGLISSLLSGNFYDEVRDEAGVRSRFVVDLADPAPDEQVEKSMRFQVFSGDPSKIDIRTQGSVAKLVQQPGRETIDNAAQQDKEVAGVARLARPDACSFCKLLATRGAVYKDHSFIESNAEFVGEGDIKVHDHCHCVEMPVFKGQKFQPTPEQKKWREVYDSMHHLDGVSVVTSFEHALKAAGV